MRKIFFAMMILAGCIILNSCQKELPGNNIPVIIPLPVSINRIPVANAGFDQVITLPKDSVTVDASGSKDYDGTISFYSWTKISGPDTFSITNASSIKAVINKLVKGTYQFELTITDNSGLIAKDTIQIFVNPIPTGTRNSSVWFWTRDTVWNFIYININNETKILYESWGGNGDPLCYPYGGSMDFELPAGNHAFKTWRQGRDTIKGSVTVYSGVCNSVEIGY